MFSLDNKLSPDSDHIKLIRGKVTWNLILTLFINIILKPCVK